MEQNETHSQPGEISPVEASNRKLLFRTVAALENEEEAMWFFDELCTPKEQKYMAQRVAATELLALGYTYGEIMKAQKSEDTTISSATIHRIQETAANGGGQLWRMIQRTSGIEGC